MSKITRGIHVRDLVGEVGKLDNGECALFLVNPWVARGSYCFYRPDASSVFLRFVCPCGCRVIHSLRLVAPGTERDSAMHGPYWEWDGSESCPTLSPSIHLSRACGWHGFLKAGTFEAV
jgi:hypothetical protein